jgi:hypothetical protein
MVLYSPLDLDIHTAHLRHERLAEAAHERLISQALAHHPRPLFRARLALALHAVADWLEPGPAACTEAELATT